MRWPNLRVLGGTNSPLNQAWLLACFGFSLGLISYFVGGQITLGPETERWVAPLVALAIVPFTILTILQFRHDNVDSQVVFRTGVYATCFGAPLGALYRSVGGDTLMSLSGFYETAAQVTAGLLIALVVEAWRREGVSVNDARRAGVYFILLGLTATLIALLPWTRSDNWVSFAMLPIVVGCLGASVAAFLSIASELGGALPPRSDDANRREQ